MSTKSKAVYIEEKIVEHSYLSDYNQLLEVMQSMMQHCSNYRTEAFNQASLLRTIANRKAYFDVLRERAADLKKQPKVSVKQLEFIYNAANAAIDNKVCDWIWSQAAEMYDNFINMTAQATSNDSAAITMFKTADEILAKAYEYQRGLTDEQQTKDDMIKSLDFMFNSTF